MNVVSAEGDLPAEYEPLVIQSAAERGESLIQR